MARKAQGGVTLVAPDTQIVGDLQFRDQLFVNGRIHGNVLAAGDEGTASVVISEEAVVQGEIRVPNVVINGLVEGDVYASVRLELAPKARIVGNVYYKLIEMQLGAVVHGHMLHDDSAERSNVHPFPADAERESPRGSAGSA